MYPHYIKRLLDIILAVILLPLVLLVILVCGALIFAEDRGSIFYNAPRMGRNMKPFTMYKLRTMHENAPDLRFNDGSTYNAVDDPRMTRIGSFLRKTSIDELPQVFNVLLGQMSLIGPRPDDLKEAELYQGNQATKLTVRPGITGYAQVYGRNAITWSERLALDVEYTERISFWLDLKILLRTFAVVFMQRDIYAQADVGAESATDAADIKLVSLVVVAYNEEDHLTQLLDDIQAQDFPHQALEVILVDSNAGANTRQRQLMDQFAQGDYGFRRVLVVDNPKITLPAGCNRALAVYQGDVFVRVDAHARIPMDFVTRNAEVLQEGNKVCGGYRPVVLKQQSSWAETLLAAESSAFGASAADYRRVGVAQEVRSVFHAAYRREVIDAVGFYDERLQRTEDNDFNWRVGQAGYQIVKDPRIYSEQYLRPSLASLLMQKNKNGFWIGRTIFINPRVVSGTHLVPLIFLLATLGGLLVGLVVSWMPLAMLGMVYLAAALLAGFKAAARSKHRNLSMLALPLVFLGLHMVYGIGTLHGIISGIGHVFAQALKQQDK